MSAVKGINLTKIGVGRNRHALSSVSAITLSQLEVTLSGDGVSSVQSSDVVLKDANGGVVSATVTGAGTDTVTIVTGGKLESGATYKVIVKGVEKSFVAKDDTKPYVASVTPLNTRQLQLVFSEPLTDGNGGTAVFASGNFTMRNETTGAAYQLTGDSTVVLKNDGKTVIITLGLNDTAAADGTTTVKPDVFASGIGFKSGTKYQAIFNQIAGNTIYDANNNNVINGSSSEFTGVATLDAQAPQLTNSVYDKATHRLYLIYDEPVTAPAANTVNKVTLKGNDQSVTLITAAEAGTDTTGNTKRDDTTVNVINNQISIVVGDTSKAKIESIIASGKALTVSLDRDFTKDVNTNPNEVQADIPVTLEVEQPALSSATYDAKTDRLSLTFDRVIDLTSNAPSAIVADGAKDVSITGTDKDGNPVAVVLKSAEVTQNSLTNTATLVYDLAKSADYDASDAERLLIEKIESDAKVTVEAGKIKDLNGRINGDKLVAPLTINDSSAAISKVDFNESVNGGTLYVTFDEKVDMSTLKSGRFGLSVTDNGTTKDYYLTANGLVAGTELAVDDTGTALGANRTVLALTTTGTIKDALTSSTLTSAKLYVRTADPVKDESGTGLAANTADNGVAVNVTDNYGDRKLNFQQPSIAYNDNNSKTSVIKVKSDVKLNPTTLRAQYFTLTDTIADANVAVTDVKLLSDEQTVVLTASYITNVGNLNLSISKDVQAKVGDAPTGDATFANATASNATAGDHLNIVKSDSMLGYGSAATTNINDVDGSKTATKGDIVSIDFSLPIKLNRTLTAADFNLGGGNVGSPAAAPSLGTGFTAAVDSTYPNRLNITLGDDANIGLGTTTITTVDMTSQPSPAIEAVTVGDKAKGGFSATINAPTGTEARASLQSAVYVDANNNGLKDKGDYILVTFSAALDTSVDPTVAQVSFVANDGDAGDADDSTKMKASWVSGRNDQIKLTAQSDADAAAWTLDGTETFQTTGAGSLKSAWGNVVAAKSVIVTRQSATSGNPTISKAEFYDLGKEATTTNPSGANVNGAVTSLDALVLTFDRPVSASGTITAADIEFDGTQFTQGEWFVSQPFADKSKVMLVNVGGGDTVIPDSTKLKFTAGNLTFTDIDGHTAATQSNVTVATGSTLTGLTAGFYGTDDANTVMTKYNTMAAFDSGADTNLFVVGDQSNQATLNLATNSVVNVFGLRGYSSIDSSITLDDATEYVGGLTINNKTNSTLSNNAVIDDAGTAVADGIVIEQNTINFSTASGNFANADAGIQLTGNAAGDATIRYNTFTGENASDATPIISIAAPADAAKTLTITYNNIESAKNAGIELALDDTDTNDNIVDIQNNVITKAGNAGIYVSGTGAAGDTLTIKGNKVEAYGTNPNDDTFEFGVALANTILGAVNGSADAAGDVANAASLSLFNTVTKTNLNASNTGVNGATDAAYHVNTANVDE